MAGPSQSEDNRTRILRTAERILAEEGIGASLREIARAAGQGNTRAAQYYFEDRTGLIIAVMAPHREQVAQHRHQLLDGYEQAAAGDVRTLAAAFVVPLAAKLGDPAGRRYLRIAAEYLLSTSREVDLARRPPDTSIVRWHELLDDLVGRRVRNDPFQRFAPRISAVRVTLMSLARQAAAPTPAQTDAGPLVDDDLFVSFLIDQVAALLAVRMSPETVNAKRRAARRRSRPR